MSVIAVRAAAWLLALLMLALPHVRGQVSRSDAFFTYTTQRDTAWVLRPPPLVAARDERLSGGKTAVLLPRAAALPADGLATPRPTRLGRLVFGNWPRVGHQRDPPTT
jgi:hypothetical protein